MIINNIDYDFYNDDGHGKIYFRWKGKWSYGECYFRGTVIKCNMCEHTFYSNSTDDDCLDAQNILNQSLNDLDTGHDCALRFTSIDEVLEFLSKPSNRSDYESDLKDELNDRQYELDKICHHVKDLYADTTTRMTFRSYENLYLIENLTELIQELMEINAVAKEHNVIFEWI